MMRRPVVALVAVLAGLGVDACAHEQPSAAARAPVAAKEISCRHPMPACLGEPPRYTEDVLPILERRCFKCHAGDGAAAEEHNFSLLDTVRAQKNALASEVSSCAMPPSSESPVPDAEAEMLLRWVACAGVAKPH
jgi:hypothetical protein